MFTGQPGVWPLPWAYLRHVITIPGFGTITLAKVTIKHEDPHEKTKAPKKTTVTLTMVDLKLGCFVDGNLSMGNGSTNGGPDG